MIVVVSGKYRIRRALRGAVDPPGDGRSSGWSSTRDKSLDNGPITTDPLTTTCDDTNVKTAYGPSICNLLEVLTRRRNRVEKMTDGGEGSEVSTWWVTMIPRGHCSQDFPGVPMCGGTGTGRSVPLETLEG